MNPSKSRDSLRPCLATQIGFPISAKSTVRQRTNTAMSASKKLEDADSAIEHLKRVASLADDLKRAGASIYEHHWDYLCFGSWTITAGKRKDCFEFSWDGRDYILSVSHSADISGGRPQTWQPLESYKLSPDDGKDPLAFIDEFFRKRKNPS